MTIYFFIFLLFFIPLLQTVAYKRFLKTTPNPLLISVMSSIAIFLLILLSVFISERNLQSELNAFDLNGDGFFSGEELTPEQDVAVMRVTSDTARTFAPITGGIFCFLYFIVQYCLLKFSVRYKQINKMQQ